MKVEKEITDHRPRFHEIPEKEKKEKPIPCEIAAKIYREHSENCKVCQAYYAWFADEMIEKIDKD